jgi:hypothetical protein
MSALGQQQRYAAHKPQLATAKVDISHCKHLTVRGLTFDPNERGRASLHH